MTEPVSPNPAGPDPAGRDPAGTIPATGGQRVPGRGLRLALAASVALNLAVLGLGLGLAFHGGPGGDGDMVRDLGFGPFSEALGPGDRRTLRGAFLQRMPDFRAERQRMAADAQAILASLRATPFDPAALDSAMQAMQAHVVHRMDLGRVLMQDFLTRMSPKERAAFADRLEMSLRHGPAGERRGED